MIFLLTPHCRTQAAGPGFFLSCQGLVTGKTPRGVGHILNRGCSITRMDSMKRSMVFLFALAVAFAMTTSSFAWQTGTEAGQEQKQEAKKETKKEKKTAKKEKKEKKKKEKKEQKKEQTPTQ